MTIEKRLKEAMGKGDGHPAISQMDLHRLSHVPQPTIARILKGGGKKGPETDTLKKLADALGIEFLWLLQGTEPKYRGGIVSGDAKRIAAVPPRNPVFKRHWLSEDEADHLANYRSLTKVNRDKVRSLAKGLKRDRPDLGSADAASNDDL